MQRAGRARHDGEANSLGISERIAVLEGLVARGIPAAKMLRGPAPRRSPIRSC